MAELPSSWGLKKKPRQDGKLDIIGKDDTGKEYKVRTTDGPEVTDKDIRDIAAVDREQTDARTFVKSVIQEQSARNAVRESAMEDDFTAVAEDIVGQCTSDGRATRAGQVDLALKCGMSSAYARGERYWREVEEWRRRGCPLPEIN